MKKFTMLVSLILSLLLAGCTVTDGKKVATVDDIDISTAEYKYYLTQIKGQIEQTENTDKSPDFWSTLDKDKKPMSDVAKDKALEEAINSVVVYKKAVAEGIKLTQEDITTIGKQKNQSIQSMGGKSQFEEWLKKNNLSNNMYDTLLERSMYRYKLTDKIGKDISEGDAKVFYMQNNVTVKHILVKTTDANEQPLDEKVVAEKKKLAEDLLKRAKAGEDFDALVAEFSEDPGSKSQPEGYTFGENSGMVKPFEEASLALKEGAVSEIVPTSFGFHIIKRYPTNAAEFDKNVEQNLAAAKNDKVETSIKEWTNGFNVVKDEKQLAKIKIEDIIVETGK